MSGRAQSLPSETDVPSGVLVQTKNSPAASLGLQPAGAWGALHDSHVRERLMDFFLEAIKK